MQIPCEAMSLAPLPKQSDVEGKSQICSKKWGSDCSNPIIQWPVANVFAKLFEYVWIHMNQENYINCIWQGRDCVSAYAHSNFMLLLTSSGYKLQLPKDQVTAATAVPEWITAPPSTTAESPPGNEASWNLIDLDWSRHLILLINK